MVHDAPMANNGPYRRAEPADHPGVDVPCSSMSLARSFLHGGMCSLKKPQWLTLRNCTFLHGELLNNVPRFVAWIIVEDGDFHGHSKYR